MTVHNVIKQMTRSPPRRAFSLYGPKSLYFRTLADSEPYMYVYFLTNETCHPVSFDRNFILKATTLRKEYFAHSLLFKLVTERRLYHYNCSMSEKEKKQREKHTSLNKHEFTDNNLYGRFHFFREYIPAFPVPLQIKQSCFLHFRTLLTDTKAGSRCQTNGTTLSE